MMYTVEYFLEHDMKHREQEFSDSSELVLSEATEREIVIDKRKIKWFDEILLKTRVRHVWETIDVHG